MTWMISRGFNRLRCELSYHLAVQEMVRGQWDTVSWIRALISQRPGIEKRLYPGKHCNQLLVGHISVSYNGISGFLGSFHNTSCAPPKCGAPGGLNLHVTPSSAVLLSSFCLSNWLTSFFNSSTASTKFVPLSLITSLRTPRRLVKRVKAFRNVSVSRRQAISKCTARVSKQVNRHSHLF